MPETYLESEIATQPDDWRRAAEVARKYADLLPEPGERVAVIGCGTSLYMARAYASLRESTGQGLTDAWPASEARLARGYDRVIAITRSGTTTEVLEALRAYDGDARTTVISSSPGTPVLELADPILIDDVDERSVVQTRFATTTLAILRWHLGEDLAPVIAQAERALAADPAPGALRNAEQFTFVGMGLGAAVAEECALKMRESCQAWTEAYPATEYRHGPISISAPGRVVWALGPLVPNFARDVAATGAHLEHDDVDPMVDLVRLQRLCVVRAADAGLDPDNPRNLTRSIILEP
ncbi:SIS domain-containing protein [Solicola gregarius]|uniref:Glutamine--fructose-6-phosphate aminotransferase [isomerizing] n=1 Tax=Solicola gregarius TaxID=2908642 RepID=A0AA46TF09_9ACTN|nr:sugar isomerase [Solicola gregarius]UYM04147.1 sugar isomerase [Solicola gregarius]